MFKLKLLTLLLLMSLGTLHAAEISVKVIALFEGKAMLQVNGQQKILSEGEVFEGVLLKFASGRGAVVEIAGAEQKLDLNQFISAGNYKKRERANLKIYPDAVGMYFVIGEINDQPTNFLVDTGATFVTISGDKARLLGVDYEKGQRSSAQTAASVVASWLVKLDSISIGGIKMRNVDAMVIPGRHPQEVLLGNSFLNHTSMIRAGQALEISKRY